MSRPERPALPETPPDEPDAPDGKTVLIVGGGRAGAHVAKLLIEAHRVDSPSLRFRKRMRMRFGDDPAAEDQARIRRILVWDDDTGPCSWSDVGEFVLEKDVKAGRPRLDVVAMRLGALSPSVEVEAVRGVPSGPSIVDVAKEEEEEGEVCDVVSPKKKDSSSSLWIPPVDGLKEILQGKHGPYDSVDVVVFAGCCPIAALVEHDEVCRHLQVPFVACEAHGIFAALFCDFGETFCCVRRNDKDPITHVIVGISQSNPARVKVCKWGFQSHEMREGDSVVFEKVGGMTALNEMGSVRVVDEGEDFEFAVGVDTSTMPAYVGGTGYCHQRIRPVHVSQFVTLAEALENPRSSIDTGPPVDDSRLMWGPKLICPAFRALHRFQVENGRRPIPFNKEDAEEVLLCAREWTKFDSVVPTTSISSEDYVRLISYTYAGQLVPVVSMIASVAAGEVHKALTGVYEPIGWFFTDFLHVLDICDLPTQDDAAMLEKSMLPTVADQVCVLGRSFQDLLSQQRLLLCGCGPVGSDVLASLAQMGIGEVIVSDSSEGGGASRAAATVDLLRERSPRLQVAALSESFARPEYTFTDSLDDSFWESRDCIIQTEKPSLSYVGSMSQLFEKPVLRTVILRGKCRCRCCVAVPHATGPIGELSDEREPRVANDAIRHYSYRPKHAILFTKRLFCRVFGEEMGRIAQHCGDGGELPKKVVKKEDVVDVSVLVKLLPQHFEDCVRWAHALFCESFDDDIRCLLERMPPTRTRILSRSSSGELFWCTGARRLPHPTGFDPSNDDHRLFVWAASQLRAQSCGIEIDLMLLERDWKKFSLRPDSEDSNELSLAVLRKRKPSDCPWRELVLSDTPISRTFVLTSSRIRAANYNIPQPDEDLILDIVFDRVPPPDPFIASFAAACACCEVYSVLRGRNNPKLVPAHRNTFANLATPTYARAKSIPPKRGPFLSWTISAWDSLSVSVGRDVSVAEFRAFIGNVHKVTVDAIRYCGRYIIGAWTTAERGTCVPEADYATALLGEACFALTKTEPSSWQCELVLEVVVYEEDEDSEDGRDDMWRFPRVVYRFRGF